MVSLGDLPPARQFPGLIVKIKCERESASREYNKFLCLVGFRNKLS